MTMDTNLIALLVPMERLRNSHAIVVQLTVGSVCTRHYALQTYAYKSRTSVILPMIRNCTR